MTERSDRWRFRRRGSKEAEELLDETGYSQLVFDRLAYYAVVALDGAQAAVLVHEAGDDAGLILVAGHGTDPELIGLRFEDGGPDAPPGAQPIVLINEYAAPGTHTHRTPILRGGVISGVLEVARSATHPYTSDDEVLAAQTASVLSAALDHARMPATMKREMQARTGELGMAMDERAGYTVAMSFELDLAMAVAEHLGLDIPTAVEVRLATMLRNIGLIGVPDSVLESPSRLGKDDWALMAQQPIWAAESLVRVPGLEPVGIVVLYHREWWDGSGYPDGLSGSRIPMASRIVAACSAYRALISERPHRGAYTPSDAIEKIRQGSGTQFDPGVASALAAVVAGALEPKQS